ncbi:MAG TPA: tetratricopeptide repeat protein [Pyrinomonadaceae bacterium]|nr:tetratricopeptide repeat protein [Pyrinomonadaceae bacterium]
MPESSSPNSKLFIAGAACLILGFVAGFFLANGLNRQEQDRLRAEVTSLKAGGPTANANNNAQPAGRGQQTQTAGEDSLPQLTDEQLANAVTKADAAPSDAELQRKVGQGLYVYAWQTGNASILPDVARILKRAHELDPKDYKTTVMAADAQFLIARSGNDPKPLAEARKLYESALAAKPDDAVVRTSLGLTYFYDSPSDPQRAIREYRRALQTDPKQEMPLQSLAAALVETGAFDEASKRLDELEKLNPSNKDLPNLRAHLEQKRNAAKEGQK